MYLSIDIPIVLTQEHYFQAYTVKVFNFLQMIEAHALIMSVSTFIIKSA